MARFSPIERAADRRENHGGAVHKPGAAQIAASRPVVGVGRARRCSPLRATPRAADVSHTNRRRNRLRTVWMVFLVPRATCGFKLANDRKGTHAALISESQI